MRHCLGGVSLDAAPCTSTSLRPFAPRALPRFIALMDALTPVRPALRRPRRVNAPRLHGVLRRCARLNAVLSGQVSLIHSSWPSPHSATNHLMRSSPRFSAVRPAGEVPQAYPFRLAVGASPSPSWLATAPGRIVFVACGLRLCRRLLSTPPPGDAVASGFPGADISRTGTFTPLTTNAFRRTGSELHSRPAGDC